MRRRKLGCGFFSADEEDRDVTAVGGGAIAGGGKTRRRRPCCNLPWISTSLSFFYIGFICRKQKRKLKVFRLTDKHDFMIHCSNDIERTHVKMYT